MAIKSTQLNRDLYFAAIAAAAKERQNVKAWIETAIREKLEAAELKTTWSQYFDYPFDEDGFIELYAQVFVSLSSSPCQWRYIYDVHDGLWRSECGVEFVLADGTPGDNNMAFCTGCGRPLVEVVAQAGHVGGE